MNHLWYNLLDTSTQKKLKAESIYMYTNQIEEYLSVCGIFECVYVLLVHPEFMKTNTQTNIHSGTFNILGHVYVFKYMYEVMRVNIKIWQRVHP